jgi:hypothetical protein
MLGTCAAAAQNSNKENAPYSRFGLGEQYYGTNTPLRGMGYTSAAYSSTTTVNADNPASYASLKLTTYEAGLLGATRTISAAGTKYTTGSASLAYLTVGIPVGKYAGLALGLRPQTRVYYHNVDTVLADPSRPWMYKNIQEYSGEGGLNFAYLGAAGKYRGFSLGFNFGYMFGTIRNSATLVNIDTVRALNSDFSRFTRYGGIYWQGGAQYEALLTRKMKLQLGATAMLSQDLHAYRDEYATSYRLSGGGTQTDTAFSTLETAGTVTLPLTYTFGAQLSGDRWAVAAQYSNTAWNQYRNNGITTADTAIADHTSRISVGGEYTPNPASVYKYLPRVTYRLGFYYGTDYVRLRNTELNYYAVTAGASLPFRRSTDRVHLALEYGSRGTNTANLIKENFFKFTLGISLNDKWFIKRSYD